MSATAKAVQLSIVLAAIDNATKPIREVKARLDEAAKPAGSFASKLHEIGEHTGISKIAEGFKGVGEAVKETLFKLVEVGAIIGETVHLVFELVEHFEELGKKAERLGVGVDYLAGMRYAAENAGVPIDKLDDSLLTFNVNLGKLSANTGRLKAFLDVVGPGFERQLKGAKNNAEAFDLLARAMAKIPDPMRRAALAQVAFGDSALVPLLAKGPKAIKEYRDRFAQLAGSQEGAVEAAEKTKKKMIDLHASLDGVKAAILEGLSPALDEILPKLTKWFVSHRADIKEWAENLGKRIPAAFDAVVSAIGSAIDAVRPFVNETWKLQVIAVVVAAALVGPLVASLVSLGIAIAPAIASIARLGLAAITTAAAIIGPLVASFVRLGIAFALTPFGMVLTACAAVGAAVYLIIDNWNAIAGFFKKIWKAVVGVFEWAWDLISPIVDKIVAAAKAVKDVIGTVVGANSFDSAQDQLQKKIIQNRIEMISAGLPGGAAMAAAAAPPAEAKVTVDFTNLPRGARVNTDPQNTRGVDLSVGYQMVPGFP